MLNLDTHLRLDDSIPRAANLTSRFSEEDLAAIGSWVWEGYTADVSSRTDWLRRSQSAMNLALQLQKDKTFPWAGSSNVAFPLVTIAAMQFHARAYPAIISGTDVVKYRTPSYDPTGEALQRALRVGRYMSYQVLEEDQAWEEQHDRLLLQIPIVGCAFVKTQYSPSRGHNVSELVAAVDLVMDYYAKSVESCGRKTHQTYVFRNQVHEFCASGVWRDICDESWYKTLQPPYVPEGTNEADKRKGLNPSLADEATPLLFLEQHCLCDFDKDGYQEPYAITVEANSKQVVRIVARWEDPLDVERNGRGQVIRIRATEYFTKYGLIPSPDGSIYDMGFGVLLGPLNESVNSLVNQLIDSGTLSNAAGGFLSRGVKIRGGAYTFQPFGWQRVDSTGDDLRKGVVPLPVREPSQVLFTLLSFLVNYAQRVGGATDAISGENPGQNTPAATQASMIEQGSRIYSALFKRVWRCMKEEFGKLYILNARHLPVSKPFGMGGKIAREDFLGDSSQICPVADPNITSDTLRLQQASAVAQRAREVSGYNVDAAEKLLLQAMKVDGIDAIYPGTKSLPPPAPAEKVQVEMLKQQVQMATLQQEQQQFVVTMMEESRKNDAQIEMWQAQAMNFAANADSEQQGKQIAMIDAMIGLTKARNEHIHATVQHLLDAMKIKVDEKKVEAMQARAEGVPSGR